ncbi:hypothetical protein WJX82_004358 [Trebouxia sp. C0006]
MGSGSPTSFATSPQTCDIPLRSGRTAGRGARLVNRVLFARSSAPVDSMVANNSHEQDAAIQRLAAQQKAKASTVGVTSPQLAVHEQAQHSSGRSSVAGPSSMFTHYAASTAGVQKPESEQVAGASGLISAHKGESRLGHYKAAKPQVLSGISKQRQFGRLRSHHSCCMCQGQSVPHALAAAKRRISRLERQVLQLSKTVSHQSKKPKAVWEEVRLQDNRVRREPTTTEKAVGHASHSSTTTARVDYENTRLVPLAHPKQHPHPSSYQQSSSHQASASGRSLLEESGSSLRFVGSSAASGSTSFSDSQAASPLAAAHAKADAARAAAGAGAFCDAVILCSEGLKMKPEDARVRARLYHNRGVAYSNLGLPILAIGDCSMAHRLSPTQCQPLYHRDLAYDAIGATTDALQGSQDGQAVGSSHQLGGYVLPKMVPSLSVSPNSKSASPGDCVRSPR